MPGSKATVRVDGLRDLRRELRRAGRDMTDLKDANAAAAALVAGAARAGAPHRTGSLAGSGRGNRAAGKATVSFGGARLPYAGPIHYGWPAHHITANPFVIDAALATEPQWLPLYEHDLAGIADSIAGTY